MYNQMYHLDLYRNNIKINLKKKNRKELAT